MSELSLTDDSKRRIEEHRGKIADLKGRLKAAEDDLKNLEERRAKAPPPEAFSQAWSQSDRMYARACVSKERESSELRMQIANMEKILEAYPWSSVFLPRRPLFLMTNIADRELSPSGLHPARVPQDVLASRRGWLRDGGPRRILGFTEHAADGELPASLSPARVLQDVVLAVHAVPVILSSLEEHLPHIGVRDELPGPVRSNPNRPSLVVDLCEVR